MKYLIVFLLCELLHFNLNLSQDGAAEIVFGNATFIKKVENTYKTSSRSQRTVTEDLFHVIISVQIYDKSLLKSELLGLRLFNKIYLLNDDAYSLSLNNYHQFDIEIFLQTENWDSDWHTVELVALNDNLKKRTESSNANRDRIITTAKKNSKYSCIYVYHTKEIAFI